ncbi:MAG: FAD-dependent oxidoreductase, partial [Burkholderiaceae bacterium]
MWRSLDAVLDVMRVPASGDVSVAVLPVPQHATAGSSAHDCTCEVLIVGGGTGGVAAALAAARAGRQVVLLEETDWLGGQMTAQGVSALDEHEYIETFGGTASYYRLRGLLRDTYRDRAGAAGLRTELNPGACWVTRLAFEPSAAVAAIEQMLHPFVESGRLTIHRRTKVVAAETLGDRIVTVIAMDLEAAGLIRFRPELVIDATELGDLLPLSGAEHVIGAETIAQTGEPQAQPLEPKPQCVQSFTYTFACERRIEGENHAIPRPEKYEHYRATQPYSLRIEVHGGEIYGETSGWLDYKLYDTMPGTKGGLWTYRRLLDRAMFAGSVPHDVTLFNWPGNDYRDCSILEGSALDAARALQDAKRVSLGFLHWLQTEAPASGTRLGAPELRLRPDVMGSADGLCKFPYIREPRRIKAKKTIVEQEVSTTHQSGPRAAHFADSVGVGWY